MAMLDHALALAARGFRIFPLIPGTKRPAIEKWQDRATTDTEIIRKVWSQREYNIGIATGQGLVVLDVDIKDGKQGPAALAALNLGDALDTLKVITASGGEQYYFHTDQVVRNSASRLGDGLDVRGDGGYVVAPPSVYTNGSGSGEYRWATETPIRLMPAFIPPSRTLERSDIPLVDLDDESAVARGRDWLRDAPTALEGRGGDHLTLMTAMRLKDFGVSETVAFELMVDHWNDRCSPPWELDELKAKVENAYRYGTNPPGSDHPKAIFGDVQIDQPVVQRHDPNWFRHGDAYDITKTQWLFYEVLPSMGTAVVVGPSQAGKTFFVTEMSRCLATGKPFFNVVPDELGGTVVLFAGSEGSGWPLRLAALQEDQALPISATVVSDLAGRGALGALIETLKIEAERMELMFGVPLRLVVLETLSASGLLQDENSNAEAARAWANLGQIARMLNVVFLTTHHPLKDGKGMRGAGAITGNTDGVIEITREGREDLRRVEVIKARNAPQRALGTYTLVEVELGKDAKGRPVKSMTVSMGEAIKSSLGRPPSHMKEFQRALDITDLQTVGDEDMMILGEVKDSFKDCTSSMDRSNRAKAFDKLKTYCIDAGTLEHRVIHGVEYLIRKDFE